MTQARQRRRKSSSLRLPGSVIPSVISSTFRLKQRMLYTVKNKIKFSSYIRKLRGIGCKVNYVTNSLLIYAEKFAHFLIY
jgi:hypothetical protein